MSSFLREGAARFGIRDLVGAIDMVISNGRLGVARAAALDLRSAAAINSTPAGTTQSNRIMELQP